MCSIFLLASKLEDIHNIHIIANKHYTSYQWHSQGGAHALPTYIVLCPSKMFFIKSSKIATIILPYCLELRPVSYKRLVSFRGWGKQHYNKNKRRVSN